MTFWPAGGNSYSSNGVKVIKINLTADQWLDPTSVKFFFNIKNTTDNPTFDLTPRNPGPWCFFRRCRVLCGGQIAEDIDDYGRTHQMFHIMKPAEARLNDFTEGVGLLSEGGITIDHARLDTSAVLKKM